MCSVTKRGRNKKKEITELFQSRMNASSDHFTEVVIDLRSTPTSRLRFTPRMKFNFIFRTALRNCMVHFYALLFYKRNFQKPVILLALTSGLCVFHFINMYLSFCLNHEISKEKQQCFVRHIK